MSASRNHLLTDRPILSARRSARILERDERRERERNALIMRVPKRLTRQPVHQQKKKKCYHYDLGNLTSTSNLMKMPVDLLLYLLEFLDGPSLANVERTSKSFHQLIRGPHSPYRFLYYKLLSLYCHVDYLESPDEERVIHAPVLPTVRKNVSTTESRELKVSDWKIQFVETYKYYVTEVCTICGEHGDPIPVWEVRLCRFCVVRQLINKSALYAFMLSPKEIEVLKPWKTYVYDLGMHCTFYLHAHLDHLRQQKWSDSAEDLARVVAQRQNLKFATENSKRKRKQREQEDAYADRSRAILQCFRDSGLKADLSVMEEWWFPKELKLEIHEYISNKTNNSLARKRLRITMDQQSSDAASGEGSNGNNGSALTAGGRSRAFRKSLQDIMFELKTVVASRFKRLWELNCRLANDGLPTDKLRSDLDLKTRRIYDDFVLGNQDYDSSYPLTASRTHAEILAYFHRERSFEKAVHDTWLGSVTDDDFLYSGHERHKFLRDAHEWWARRGKKPAPEKCGELYLTRVRKRQGWIKTHMALVRDQETWRRQLLERKLREKIDWYLTDLSGHIDTLKDVYERNLKKRIKSREMFLSKGISTSQETFNPPDRLKQMYCDYEDFIRNCNGFCQTDDGYCGCLEYAAKDIIKANTILRRKDWMNERLRREINYSGPENLVCPEAREEYRVAAKAVTIPKKAAVKFIARAERFMQRLLREVPTFAPDLITQQALDCYKRCIGVMSDFFDPPRRPSTWTPQHYSYFYTVNTNARDRPGIDETIAKIKEYERIRLERLQMVDQAAKDSRLGLSFWNKAMIKRPIDGVNFQTRVRWIADNGWFSFNQLAQAWVYDEECAPLARLSPFIGDKVKQMERDKRKEDINSRIKEDREFKAIFSEIDEDADFFLRASYEIGTIYKVSNLYKAHVEDVKSGIDPDRIVRQVVDLIRDVKTGVISKSSLFVADRERLAEEDDDDDDDMGAPNGGNANQNNLANANAVATPPTNNNNASTNLGNNNNSNNNIIATTVALPSSITLVVSGGNSSINQSAIPTSGTATTTNTTIITTATARS